MQVEDARGVVGKRGFPDGVQVGARGVQRFFKGVRQWRD